MILKLKEATERLNNGEFYYSHQLLASLLVEHWYRIGPKLLEMLTCFEDEKNHSKVDMVYLRDLLAEANEVQV